MFTTSVPIDQRGAVIRTCIGAALIATLATAAIGLANHTSIHRYCGNSWKGAEQFEHVTSIRLSCSETNAGQGSGDCAKLTKCAGHEADKGRSGGCVPRFSSRVACLPRAN
jgi:hypothetical protein